ncbi:MAG: SH3 domain-containing protein [Clostridia bacterium]|nr:SH3 domain-containing protein [Clostridia bacterium]
MNRKKMLSMCAFLLALALAFTALPAYAENNAYVKDTGAGKINLRSGPATQYRVLASINPGTPLEVLDVIGKWAHVYVTDPNSYGKLEGYMYVDYIAYYDSSTQYIPPSSEVVSDYGAYNIYNNYGSRVISEYTTMYVYTGNTGRLHLREGASQNARSLGLYANGTKVTVLNRSSGWAYVEVNGVRGFMMLNYLSATQHHDPQPIYVGVTKYISTGNSGRLHLREYPSQSARSLGLFPNGTKVTATDVGNGWSFVMFGGYTGYMMSRYLSPTDPIQPSPYDPTHCKVRYVCIANGHVSLRSEMNDSSSAIGNYGNGTAVYVINDYGTWSFVFVNGQYGYMKDAWLGDSPYTPSPGTPIGSARVQHPNGSFVYLRSSRSTADQSNVLAKVPSGAVVTLYQQDEWYSLISYNGIIGYMVSSYLYPAAGSASVDPAPVVPDTSSSVPSVPLMPAVPTTQAIGNAVVKNPSSSFVYLRSSRSTADLSNVLAKIPNGASVTVYQKDEWYSLISYNGTVGYIVSNYLYYGSVSPSGSSGSYPAESTAGEPLYTARSNTTVYLRSSKDLQDSSNILATIPTGGSVYVFAKSGDWLRVMYNGLSGYVPASCFD